MCLLLAICVGCAAVRDFPAAKLPPGARLIETGSIAGRARGASGLVVPAGTSLADQPQTILVLSGGGMNGAFPAGLLKGWSASGTRPRFDVVTGISTGALIAPFAFVGPEYDEELERVYTSVNAAQIYRLRSLLALPWSDALADSEPLRRRIKHEVTGEMLEKIAREHRSGRRLYVGTTNLDTLQQVVWDLGAIAAGDDPQKLDLFHDVLLASCSVPGLLPPVPINIQIDGKRYSELHADGNVSSSLLLPPQLPGIGGDGLTDDESNPVDLYVVIAGKLAPEPTEVERRLFHVSDVSLKGLIQSQMESDLQRVYLLTRLSGARFHLAAIPEDLPTKSQSMSFDPRSMRQVFEAGRQFGEHDGPWLEIPPGTDPAEGSRPRRGVTFTRRGNEVSRQ